MEFEIREENIDGFEKWTWVKEDTGGWTGPMNDWRKHHKSKIIKYCKNFNVVIQAGGCMGMYPRLLSKIFGVVYTFEPDPTNFYCLVNNTQGRNVVSFNAAIGETPGLISMIGPREINRGTGKVEEKETSFIPRMIIDQIPYRHCDLIMLDLESYEGPALKGAMETMAKFNPVVFAERGRNVIDFMKRLGYENVDHASADTIFVREKKL